MTAVEVLRRSSLFKDFTETGLKIFAAISQEKVIPAGTPLFVENTVGESLFIVRSGSVRIVQTTSEGERELAVVGPGEHLGELALLARTVRLVSALAQTQCEVLEITHGDYTRLQPQKPQACLKLALAIATGLATRVIENRELLRELASRKASGP